MRMSSLTLAGMAAVAGLAAANSTLAVVVYDYGTSAGSGLTLAQPRPTTNADVGTLAPLPAGQQWQIDSITVARAHGGVAGSVDIGFFLWGSVDTAAPAGTSIFSSLLTSISFNRVVAAGNTGVLTTNITFTPGSLLMNGGSTFGYQMEYAAPGTINLTTAAYTPNTIGVGAFFADQGLSLAGASADGFWANSSADGTVQAADGPLTFAAPNTSKSNVYLVINATVVPAPASAAMLGLGGLMAARRRRN
jgi:hypothetical protein